MRVCSAQYCRVTKHRRSVRQEKSGMRYGEHRQAGIDPSHRHTGSCKSSGSNTAESEHTCRVPVASALPAPVPLISSGRSSHETRVSRTWNSVSARRRSEKRAGASLPPNRRGGLAAGAGMTRVPSGRGVSCAGSAVLFGALASGSLGVFRWLCGPGRDVDLEFGSDARFVRDGRAGDLHRAGEAHAMGIIAVGYHGDLGNRCSDFWLFHNLLGRLLPCCR